MALKKSQLYSSLWSSCDELRGGMDASQYKDYVLTLLFVKYVSDKYAGRPNALIEIPAVGGFADIVKLIWINLELAKKSPACLEYIVVHELVHLIERRHNERFRELMDRHLPQWRLYRDELNRAPLAHEDWIY